MNEEKDCYVKGDFKLGPTFIDEYVVSITSKSILYESKSTKVVQKINLDNVVGSHVGKLSMDNTMPIKNTIHIISYPFKKRMFSSSLQRCRVEHVFIAAHDGNVKDSLETAEKFVRCIKWLLEKPSDGVMITEHKDNPPQRQFLIFINPFGGQGSAQTIFEKNIKPMLNDANVDFDTKITARKGHAQEIIENMNDLKKYDCIVCCSGDGIVNEVINGLMQHRDWEEVIKIPLGHIPCGSGNGLCAAALHHADEPFDLVSSVFNVITGDNLPMDIIKAQTSKQEVRYSFLSIVFGIVSDVDIESERFRFIGDLRFSIVAIQKIFSKKVFSGKLWYLPAKDDSTMTHRNGDMKCRKNSLHCQREDGVVQSEDNETLNCHQNKATKSSTEDEKLNDCDVEKSKVQNGVLSDQRMIDESTTTCSPFIHTNLPDFDEEIPETWKLIEDDFVGLLFLSLSHIGNNVFSAPKATFGDGIIHCMRFHGGMSRTELVKVMTNFHNGEHVNVNNLSMYEARAFRLESTSTTSDIITMDGERFQWDKLQAEIYKGLARVRCRLPNKEKCNYLK